MFQHVLGAGVSKYSCCLRLKSSEGAGQSRDFIAWDRWHVETLVSTATQHIHITHEWNPA